MALDSPKITDGYPSSISSRDSFSSDEAGGSAIVHSRPTILPSSPIRSSLSNEVIITSDHNAALPAHSHFHLKANKFYKTSREEQSGKKRLQERASWSKAFPRPSSSRSGWPSASKRDLLREAGEWLDAEYPVPEVQIPDAEWRLAFPPQRQDLTSSSLPSNSRPTTSSTTREEADGASEKIVYNHRDAKLKELLGRMQTDYDTGNGINDGRGARVRMYLEELQTKDEERVSLAKSIVSEPVELDAVSSQKDREHCTKAPDSEQSSLCSAPDPPQVVHKPSSYQDLHQPLASINLTIDFDDQFSTAIAQALNFSPQPELYGLETSVDTEVVKTPTGFPMTHGEYFAPVSHSYGAAQMQTEKSNAESTPALEPTDFDGDASTCTSLGEEDSSRRSSTISTSSANAGHLHDLSTTPLPALKSPATSSSIFNELEHLAGASRARRRV